MFYVDSIRYKQNFTKRAIRQLQSSLSKIQISTACSLTSQRIAPLTKHYDTISKANFSPSRPASRPRTNPYSSFPSRRDVQPHLAAFMAHPTLVLLHVAIIVMAVGAQRHAYNARSEIKGSSGAVSQHSTTHLGSLGAIGIPALMQVGKNLVLICVASDDSARDVLHVLRCRLGFTGVDVAVVVAVLGGDEGEDGEGEVEET